MPVWRDEGIVLRTRNLGEADKVVTILTREHGRIEAAARGARRSRSSLLSVTQPFAYSQLLVFPNRSLHNLSQGQLIRPFRRLQEDLTVLAHASYLAELADVGLAEEELYADALDCVLSAFDLLETRGHTPDTVTHWYELHMLGILGYEPELSDCVVCRRPLGGGDEESTAYGGVMFDIDEGGCLCGGCAAGYARARFLSAEVYKSMLYLSGVEAARLANLRLKSADAAALENILGSYIERRLERTLHSLVFLRSLQTMNN